MALFRDMFRRWVLRSITKKDIEAWWIQDTATATGLSVTETTALNYSTFYAAVRIISETIASLPLKVYQRLDSGGKRVFAEHPLYALLHDAPDERTTAFTFWETLMGHVLVWGNGYAYIKPGNRGTAESFLLLTPDKVTLKVLDGVRVVYEYAVPGGGVLAFQPSEVLHVAGLGFDGVKGYSPITLHREPIALGMATEKYSAAFFGNSARPGGILKTDHPPPKDKEQIADIRRQWEDMHRGPSSAGRVGILWHGMSWEQIGLPNDVSQLLETRTFSVQEMARVFRLPPHMLADLSRATFSNIGDQARQFVVYTLLGWLRRIEQELQLKLFAGQKAFAQFSVDGLLRGDQKARNEAYKIGVTNGWLSRNEVREMEDMNPIDGLDEFLVPLNMGSGQNDDGGQIGEMNSREAFDPVFTDAAERLIRKETDRIRQAMKRCAADVAKFKAWLTTFYADHAAHAESVRRAFAPIVAGYVKSSGITVDLECVVDRHIGSSRGQIMGLIRDAKPGHLWDTIEARLKQWEQDRPKAAANEVLCDGRN